MMEFAELEIHFIERQDKDPVAKSMLETLRKKKSLVEVNKLSARDFSLNSNHLLHGDFIYTNVFINKIGEVEKVFDLEKAHVGPRAYELARSLLISCFDDGWEQRHIRDGREFLSAYREKYPIDFDEFFEGVKMYMLHSLHMNWMEARYLFEDRYSTSLLLYESHERRVDHYNDDLERLCRQLYEQS